MRSGLLAFILGTLLLVQAFAQISSPDGLSWPDPPGSLNQTSLDYLLPGSRTGFLDPASGFLLPGGLPDPSGPRRIYELPRGMYSVEQSLKEGLAYRLYDSESFRQITFSELLPIPEDSQNPRVIDLQYLGPNGSVSIVTWRNNLLPQGRLDLRLIAEDLPLGSASGIEMIQIRYGGELVNSLYPGILVERPGRGIAALRDGPGSFSLPGSGGSKQILVQGNMEISLNRALLELELWDYAGNSTLLNFVIIRGD